MQQQMFYVPNRMPNNGVPMQVPPYYAGNQYNPVLHAPYQRFGCNLNYFKSPLYWIRILLLPFLIATIVSAALVPNTFFRVRTVRQMDTNVWQSTLVFAAVGLFGNLVAILMYMCNIPNTRLCWYYPWTILCGLLDFAWFVGMIVLGALAATRESHRDYHNESINEGAFGATSAFALTSGVLCLISSILHLGKRRAPLRSVSLF